MWKDIAANQKIALGTEILARPFRDNDRSEAVSEKTFGTETVLDEDVLSDSSAARSTSPSR